MPAGQRVQEAGGAEGTGVQDLVQEVQGTRYSGCRAQGCRECRGAGPRSAGGSESAGLRSAESVGGAEGTG